MLCSHFPLDERNINRTYSDHQQDAEHLNRRVVWFGTARGPSKGEVAMFTIVAVLMFAGALIAAGATIYSTVVPALPSIQAALAGKARGWIFPPLPPRHAATTIRVTVRSVSAQPTYWRAAA